MIGPALLRRQCIRDRRRGCSRCDHVLGVSAIEIEACDLAIDAHREIATAALLAHEAMSAMPADPDALAVLPFRNITADCIDPSRDFMTRHPWKLKSGPP